ncbi:hypothetical protein OEZ85_010110 [Tetradesmus obliquus]|uniref:Small ribosomal subunit protein uS3 C-terminal domain-containing protein n=1 Tax=Tetradesmus obliquus TaxID=3088 RepID=A0ABY8TLA2_TETOB|nr:hypothetical protein OEZ85_010110 [Tetradesmus obliquus]
MGIAAAIAATAAAKHEPQQQLRGYAAKGKGGAKAAAAPPPKKAPAAPDPYAPPKWRMRRVPHSPKGGGLAAATPQQRALLERLNPGSTPLRSLRQLGWPLGQKQVLALLHDQLGAATGTNTSVLPFVLGDMYQSAASLAQVVKGYLAEGRGMPTVEQYLLTTIAGLSPSSIPFEGIKVQVKGRMSGKGGMTSKRVWTWGRTSTATISDPVDYAHEAVVTRAGYIGIKVWIRYKRSVMEDQKQHSSRSPISVAELLAMPAPTVLPSRSSSAWWAAPGPLQPRLHQAWQCYKPSYNALTATNRLPGPPPQQQQQQQQQQQLPEQ